MVALYAGLLIASGVCVGTHARAHQPRSAPPGDNATRGMTPLDWQSERSHAGSPPPPRVALSFCAWGGGPAARDRPPVILIHGGPGEGADLAPLARLLADGRDVYAPDLLGFGDTTRDVPDYSILANARLLLAWMDRQGIPRAHILGWSQGGGVALHMADLAPDRIASVTLMAAIGMQETEGSRSFHFEHARYAIGDAARMIGPWLVPHFGAIPPVPPAFTRFFSDSDQRPMAGIMRRLHVPTLVLHGRRDFLVPAWAAEEHARAIPGARLIMTPNSHFVPFWPQAERKKVAGWLGAFWSAHDGGSFADPANTAGAGSGDARWMDLAPRPRLFGRLGQMVADAIIAVPWWVIVLGLAVLARRRDAGSRWVIAGAGAMVVSALIDYGVAWVGLTLGTWIWLVGGFIGASRSPAQNRTAFNDEWRERAGRGVLWAGALAALRPDLRPELPAAAASLTGWRRIAFLAAAATALAVRQLVLLITALLVLAPIVRDPFHPMGEWGVLLAVIVARVAVGVVDHLLTIPGRSLLRARITRLFRFEFWPTWVVYLLLFPTYLRGTIRARNPLAFTACNPGIENGGGVIGESKFAIMRRLRDSAAGAGLPPEVVNAVCTTTLIEPDDPAARAERWMAITSDPTSGIATPTIIKPVTGYRGRAVRRVSSRDEAERYFLTMSVAALVQPWHPGPGEVGVAWLRGRRTGAPEPSPPTGRIGHIFSITYKEFAALTGDGRHTVEQLIWRHPRYRLQAMTFLSRLAGERLRVLAPGERLSLGVAGNHCQGSLFRDGAHLITPELEAAVDQLAAAYVGPDGRPGGLDAIRIDIRYRCEDDLKAGRLDANAIVEMNGTTGESTNIYDPDKPLSWSLNVLSAQWAALYDLGRERMDAGVRPLSIPRLFATLFRGSGRAGSALSD